MAGAGGDENGATRGGLVRVFGMRQLSKRLPRRDAGSRQSQLSSAAMLESGRLRSQSAGSTGVLLNRQSTAMDSNSVDPFGAIPPHQLGSTGGPHTPPTPGEASTFSFVPSAAAPSGLGRSRAPVIGTHTGEGPDPYYRPPRIRRPTLENQSPGGKNRGSWASGDWANNGSQPESAIPEPPEEGPSISGRGTPVPQAAGVAEAGINEPRRSKADYTTREVDFYYGVRGPALNANIPNRRIKTGPADPTGIPASAAGWFKNLFGGKTKEKGKGFEVVRSSRMPPAMMQGKPGPGEESVPEGIPVATGGVRNGPIDSDDESVHAGPSNAAAAAEAHEDGNLVSPLGSEDEESDGEFDHTRISDIPPTLPGIEIGETGIELPSRFPSKATSKASTRKAAKTTDPSLIPDMPTRVPSNMPYVPRKSSKRMSQNIDMSKLASGFIDKPSSSVEPSPLPFERSATSNRQSMVSTQSSIAPPEASSHTQDESTVGNFADMRPTSIGYVNQHSIRTINQSEHPEFLGATAEILDGRRSGASSAEDQHP